MRSFSPPPWAAASAASSRACAAASYVVQFIEWLFQYLIRKHDESDKPNFLILPIVKGSIFLSEFPAVMVVASEFL